jgi:hypothetical protein
VDAPSWECFSIVAGVTKKTTITRTKMGGWPSQKRDLGYPPKVRKGKRCKQGKEGRDKKWGPIGSSRGRLENIGSNTRLHPNTGRCWPHLRIAPVLQTRAADVTLVSLLQPVHLFAGHPQSRTRRASEGYNPGLDMSCRRPLPHRCYVALRRADREPFRFSCGVLYCGSAWPLCDERTHYPQQSMM